jgi:hypothetical protein
MAHFQLIDNPLLLRKDWLFSRGARLFMVGDSGEEKLAIHLKNRVTIEQKGLVGPGNVLPRIVPDSDVVKIVATTAFDKLQSQALTLEGARAGRAVLRGQDASGAAVPGLELVVVVGEFENHPGMEVDLIADLCRGTDPVKGHAVHRMLHDNPENIFNENWQPIIDKRGRMACGTVCKDGAESLWGGDASDHIFRNYHVALRPGTRVLSRDQVTFSKALTERAKTSLKGWLTRKRKPVVVGVLYGPTTSSLGPSNRGTIVTNKYGQIERTGSFGHSVLIVGCNAAADEFLYIDPWYNGSKLQYEGGFAGDEFPACQSLGIFQVEAADPRGPVIRQTVATEGTFRRAAGNILEIIAGP